MYRRRNFQYRRYYALMLVTPAGRPLAVKPRSPVLTPLLPVLVLVILCLPSLGLGYFWDDYYYLTQGQSNPLTYLTPQAGMKYYRPIPEGLYFLGLLALGPAGAIVGHLINLALLAISTLLLFSLTAKLAGRRAGLLAGLSFAALGALPTIVAWTSCAPDAFAITLVLLALHLRHSRRAFLAFVAAAAALLSKESALLYLPVLILWDRLLGRKPYRIAFHGVIYGVLFAAWALVHPAFRSLLDRGFQAGGTGYLGFGTIGRAALYSGRYVLTLINVPVTGGATPWPEGLGAITAFALVSLASAVGLGWSQASKRESKGNCSLRQIAVLGASLTVPSLLLPSILVGRWNPYFIGIAALGTSLLVGTLLARTSRTASALTLAAFLLAGVWCRGANIPEGHSLTERDCRDASMAIHRVEAGFKHLNRSLPRGARTLLSVEATGKRGIYGTMVDGQALRIWYGDPTLESVRPELKRVFGPPEYLFRITSNLDVIEINPDSCFYRSNGALTDRAQLSRPIRTFARGVAASGDADRAVRILLRLTALDQGSLGYYDLRLAAMMLLSRGEIAEADRLIAATPPLPRDLAIPMIAKLFGESSENPGVDTMAFHAFGVSSADTNAIRQIMRSFRDSGYTEQALEFARRLDRLVPGDPESRAIIAPHGLGIGR